MSTSLEYEKKALLERMNATRREYRSRYGHEDERTEATDDDVFPRSRTFRFIARHPYSISLGLLVVLSTVPSRSLSKAVKSGIALSSGVLGSSARTLLMREVLPAVIRSLNSRGRM
ncbi:hypothetical protein C8R21_10756 [Nitrosospira multiformis]|uniref:Uncharacterized protein n=1 Tax=Nitrosospira multiformis TaxID=1231 RepID=A0A2T5IDG5_9PROT|nr:hypothetical protein [Nitrosospira multiformis]PTQ81875.1 hypothetical protein C8R21_10756 [Nitrosospira multiformis]